MRSPAFLALFLPFSVITLAHTSISSAGAVFARGFGLYAAENSNLQLHSHSKKSLPYAHTDEAAIPAQFWERVAALGDRAAKYAETLIDDAIGQHGPAIGVQIANVQATMSHIVKSAGAIKSEMHSAAEGRGEGIEDILAAIEKVLINLYEELKEEFPPPDRAPNHAERLGSVTMVLKRAEEAIVHVGVDHGVSEAKLREHLGQLLPHIQNVVVTIGDLAEQHPVLLETLLMSFALMLIPEEWLLNPLLRLFGFGPYGPVKGSAAAWAQRMFYGAVVSKGSWFSHLQHAGMKGVVGGFSGFLGRVGSVFAGHGH